jgi:mono/diheme cytochrome c family protein
MTSRTLVACAGLALVVGCDSLPGRPRPESRPVRPSQITDFAALYAGNCAGCHGSEAAPGAAVTLADPVYLAFADDATLRLVTSQGIPGTVMPGFARSQGGTLTDAQIEILVSGMRAHWARPGAIDGAAPPLYAAAPGDAGRGAQVYADRCSACHGARGTGGNRGGSVVDGSYLGLVSDQGLRTAVVVGRPALGMPDWRGDAPGPPMSAQDVADVVAWLIAQRPEFPGQPYPTPIATRGPHDG